MGYRFVFDEEGNSLKKINIKQAKNSFLYDTKEKKYFDFSSSFDGQIFGYGQKFFTKKTKYYISKSNRFIHSKKKILSFLAPLYKYRSDLKNYYLHVLNNNHLWQWASENNHSLECEQIEKSLYPALTQSQIILSSNQKKINWLSDLSYFFDKKKLEKNIYDGMILNSLFPHCLDEIPLQEFNFVLCSGNHLFGMGNCNLLWSKEPLTVNECLDPLPFVPL